MGDEGERGGGFFGAGDDDGDFGGGSAGAVFFVDDGDVARRGAAHGVGGEIDFLGVGNFRGFHGAAAAFAEGAQAVGFGVGLEVFVFVEGDYVVGFPLGVVEGDALRAVRGPPVEEVERPERAGKGLAGAGGAAAVVVVGLGEAEGQAHRFHGGGDFVMEVLVSLDPVAREYAGDTVGGFHVLAGFAHVFVEGDGGEVAAFFNFSGEVDDPFFIAGNVGAAEGDVGDGADEGVGEEFPAGEVGVPVADGVVLFENALEVGFVADGEGVELVAVMVADVFGDLGVFVLVVELGVGFEEAQGVDYFFDAGGLGEGEEVVDVGGAWDGGFGGRFDGGAAESQVGEAEVLEEGDELFVGWVEEADAVLVGLDCFHAEAHADEVFGDGGGGFLGGVYRDFDGGGGGRGRVDGDFDGGGGSGGR